MIEIASKEKQLKILEDEIEHSRSRAEKHWFVVGKDLCKIRDGKLHPQRTFEQYCYQRWNYKPAHAYRLCRTYEALKDRETSEAPSTPELTRENHENSTIVEVNTESVPTPELSGKAADALAEVPEEYRKKVLAAAKKSGKVTAKSIKEAAKKIVPVSLSIPDVIEKDREDREIPEPAMAIWNRRNELRPQLRALSELKEWARLMQDNQDLLYADLKFNDLVTQIGIVEQTIKRGVPHAVCTKCQGDSDRIFHCDFCKGRGMISEYQYHGMPYTPEEMKKIIEKKTSKNDSTKKLPVSSR